MRGATERAAEWLARGVDGADHDASGDEVFPTWTATPILVLPDTVPRHSIESQVVWVDVESTIVDRKYPELK